MQNFIELSAAVHERRCAQRTKTPTKTILSVATGDSNNRSRSLVVIKCIHTIRFSTEVSL